MTSVNLSEMRQKLQNKWGFFLREWIHFQGGQLCQIAFAYVLKGGQH